MFFIYTNLYIACCAALCIAGTTHILAPESKGLALPVFAAASVTIIYNLHYFYANAARRRQPWFVKNARAVHFICLMALAGIACTAARLHPAQLLTAALIGVLALLYSLPLLPGRKRLNQYGLLKIITLSLCWTAFTTWLPAAQGRWPTGVTGLLLAERQLFFFILCLLLDIRDREADAALGVHTLPVRLGAGRAYRLAFLLTALLGLVNMLHVYYGHSLPVFNAFLLTTLLTGFVVWLCRYRPHPLNWLVGVDGLLLINGLLLF